MAAPSSLFAGAVQVNGTCEVGNCANPDVVGSGNSVLTPFNFTFTFGDGDQYQIAGGFTVTNSGGFTIVAPFSVTYTGPGGTSAGTDVLTVDLLQNIGTAITSGTFTEGLRANFSSGLGAGSSIQGLASYGGKSLPLLGPASPPPNAFTQTNSALLTGLSTNPLLLDEQRVFTFGAGSSTGAVINNNENLPEPASFALFGAGLLVLAARHWRLTVSRSESQRRQPTRRRT